MDDFTAVLNMLPSPMPVKFLGDYRKPGADARRLAADVRSLKQIRVHVHIPQ
jgi:hypothetical protein